MSWYNEYQLFLFDFDGLLVNTEILHYQAYLKMCKNFGFTLDWTFNDYTQLTYNEFTGFQDALYTALPDLKKVEPNWSKLYAEKKKILFDLLSSEPVALMPGVESLLISLNNAGCKSCVVTHSSLEIVIKIKKKQPFLDLIPHWITREDYILAKPNPECYQKAIDLFGQKGDKVIGFEDSARGMQALAATSATPVLICSPLASHLQKTLQLSPRIYHYSDFITFHNLH